MYGKRNRTRLEGRIQARRQEFRDRGITIIEDTGGSASGTTRPRSGNNRGRNSAAAAAAAANEQHQYQQQLAISGADMAMASPTSFASSSIANGSSAIAGPSRRFPRRQHQQSTTARSGDVDGGEEIVEMDLSESGGSGDDDAYIASEPEDHEYAEDGDAGGEDFSVPGSGSPVQSKGKGKATKRSSSTGMSGISHTGPSRSRRSSQATTVEAAGGRGVHAISRRRQSTSSSTGTTTANGAHHHHSHSHSHGSSGVGARLGLMFTLDDRVALVQLLAQSGPNPSPADLLRFAAQVSFLSPVPSRFRKSSAILRMVEGLFHPSDYIAAFSSLSIAQATFTRGLASILRR